MQKNNPKKRNIFLVILGLVISSAVIFPLIILFLSYKHQSAPSSIIEPQILTRKEPESESYNGIINKIKLNQKINYKEDGQTIEFIEEYDLQKNLIKRTFYKIDGKTIYLIHEYNPQTKKRIKAIYYHIDGKTINFIYEYNPINGNKIKTISFQKDGQTIASISEFDPDTNEKIKTQNYYNDGTIRW
jgi:ribosomal protein S16